MRSEAPRAWQVLRVLPACQAAWRRRQRPCLTERVPHTDRCLAILTNAAGESLLTWLSRRLPCLRQNQPNRGPELPLGIAPEDGVVVQHDLLSDPGEFVRRLEEACALAAGHVPCRGGGRATGSC